ncbi:MAG: hypothetical protein E7340_01070 [Clostridiales bacterium]|nr:hypothetical protein [Clostridiales bacterium]
MIDKRCFAVLDAINKECQNSNYKVFSVEDLLLSIPAHLGVDNSAFFECINTLCDHEYISVKYQDDLEICLCPLTKGRLVFENKLDEEIEKARLNKKYFIYSFLGALIGGIIAAIIYLIITLTVGGYVK